MKYSNLILSDPTLLAARESVTLAWRTWELFVGSYSSLVRSLRSLKFTHSEAEQIFHDLAKEHAESWNNAYRYYHYVLAICCSEQERYR